MRGTCRELEVIESTFTAAAEGFLTPNRRRAEPLDEHRAPGERGSPASLDHGTEFVAYAMADLCRFNGTETIFIDPGSPWQNGFVESFIGRMRDEHLNDQLFDTLPAGAGPRDRLQRAPPALLARLDRSGGVRKAVGN